MCQEIWKKTGTAQQRRFVSIDNIQLPETLRRNISAYYVLTGCDNVSQLSRHGKRSTWKIFHKHGALLTSLGLGALSEATMEQVEECICRIYLPNMNDKSINEVRYKLFQKDAKHREKLPPTKSSLTQHIKRAHYRSQMWYLADNPSPDLPSPVDCGWYRDPATANLHPQLMVDDPLPNDYSDIV